MKLAIFKCEKCDEILKLEVSDEISFRVPPEHCGYEHEICPRDRR